MAVMPGMVNGHTHLFQTFFRGLGDDKSLLDWLRDYIWPTASVMTAEEVGLAAMVGLIENLRTGRHLGARPPVHPRRRRISMRPCAQPPSASVCGFSSPGAGPTETTNRDSPSRPTSCCRRGDALRQRWHGAADGRIRIEHGPLIPWGCSDDAMRSSVAASRAWGGGTHVHCAETAIEVEMSLDERGMRHVPWLQALGALGPGHPTCSRRVARRRRAADHRRHRARPWSIAR